MPVNSRWRYNWFAWTDEGMGAGFILLAVLVLVVYTACG
jgi:hypothetical protein